VVENVAIDVHTASTERMFVATALGVKRYP
jgi:hypothetical protein